MRTALENDSFFTASELFRITYSDALFLDEFDRELFQAQSLGLVIFLIEQRGKSAFKSFLRALAREEEVRSALRWAYPYDTIEELNREWMQYLKKHINAE